MLNLFVKSAQATPIKIGETFLPAKNGFITIASLVNVILPNVLTVAGIIALMFVVISGLTYMTHAGKGESDKTSKDKQAFTAAIIGLMIIFGAYLFVTTVVQKLIGYQVGF